MDGARGWRGRAAPKQQATQSFGHTPTRRLSTSSCGPTITVAERHIELLAASLLAHNPPSPTQPHTARGTSLSHDVAPVPGSPSSVAARRCGRHRGKQRARAATVVAFCDVRHRHGQRVIHAQRRPRVAAPAGEEDWGFKSCTRTPTATTARPPPLPQWSCLRARHRCRRHSRRRRCRARRTVESAPRAKGGRARSRQPIHLRWSHHAWLTHAGGPLSLVVPNSGPLEQSSRTGKPSGHHAWRQQ